MSQSWTSAERFSLFHSQETTYRAEVSSYTGVVAS